MYKKCLLIVLALFITATAYSGTVIKATKTRLDAETMKAALRTTTVEEDGFIDGVVAKVDMGALPAELVDSTFQWARKKNTKYKFQYFKQGLIVRAAKIGIQL
jgi:hypothetical protein